MSELTTKQVLQNQQRQILIGRVKLANLMKLKEGDFASYVKEIEDNPLFQRLCHPEQLEEKVISYRRFPRTDLAHSFYELREGTIADSSSPEIGSLIKGREKLIPLIRSLGIDKFKKYFLYDETGVSYEEISSACNLRDSEVKEIMEFTNEFSIFSEFFNPSTIAFEDNVHYTKVAHIKRDNSGEFVICFFSPHLARGRYIINYQRLASIKRENVFSRNEIGGIETLVRRVEYINARKSVLYQVIQKLIQYQKAYFNSGDWLDMRPLTQQEVAQQIGANPSTISRIIMWRSVVTPRGEEKSISDFFFSKTRKAKNLIRNAIDDEKEPSSDEEIKHLLETEFGFGVSRRLVSRCRAELKIAPSIGKGGRKKKACLAPM